MSRSYYEWMEAKRNWYNSQEHRVANIPFPITEAVVYKRESTNPFWERRRYDAAERIPTTLSIKYTQSDIVSYLNTIARYETEKERDFLEKFYKKGQHENIGEHASKTEKFNYLFQSREMYVKLNKRIKNILEVLQFQKNETFGKSKTTTHEYFTGMAPNLSTFFASYFEEAFNEEIQEFYKEIRDNVSVEKLKDRFELAIRNAILKASERMSQIQKSDKTQIYGSGEEWQPIYEVLQEGGREYELFRDNLKNAIGATNLETLRDMLIERKKKESKRIGKNQIKEMFRSQLKGISSRTAQIGGSILEPVSTIIANYVNGARNNEFQIHAENLGGSKVVTDTMLLFSTNLELDLGQIMENLRQAMYSMDSSRQRQLYQSLERFYNEQEEKINDLYMVYVNAKNYGIGADGSDYTKSVKGTIDDLPEFLESTGVQIGNINDFLNFVLNTGEGAIRYDQRDEAMETCASALKMAAAKLMFDDYQTLGVFDQDSSRHAIHMFLLDGIYVPSSEVFKAMANAAQQVLEGKGKKEDTHSGITLPNKIDDQGSDEYEVKWQKIREESKDDADFKEKLYQHWQKEYENARAAITWYANFTLRIKDILTTATGAKIPIK